MEYWVFTVTFKPNLRCAKKFKLIEKLPLIFSKFINFDRMSAHLFYTVEYHKLKYGPLQGSDDVTSPHVHGILQVRGRLTESVSELLHRELTRVCGRTQFYIKEVVTEVEGWKEYCLKDSDRLNAAHNYQHVREMELTQCVSDNIYLEEVDLID